MKKKIYTYIYIISPSKQKKNDINFIIITSFSLNESRYPDDRNEYKKGSPIKPHGNVFQFNNNFMAIKGNIK